MVVVKNTKDKGAITPYKLYTLCSFLCDKHTDALSVSIPKTITEVREQRQAAVIMKLLKNCKDLLVKYNWTMSDVESYLTYIIPICKASGAQITPSILYSFLLGLDDNMLTLFTPKKSIPNQYKNWAEKEIQRILRSK